MLREGEEAQKTLNLADYGELESVPYLEGEKETDMKVIEFYMMYVKHDYRGIIRLACECAVGMAKGDALYATLEPEIDAFIGAISAHPGQ